MRITPNAYAAWISQRMLSFDFERLSNGFEEGPLSISLRMSLKEEVPEHLFLNLRFELVIPIVDPDQIEDAKRREEILLAESHCSKIYLAVERLEAEPGTKPAYILRLTPIERVPDERADPAKMQDNREGLLTLIAQMAGTGHPTERGGTLEWRNGFSLMRFYHARYRAAADRVETANPRHVPIAAIRLRGLIARLPTEKSETDPHEDAEALERLLAEVDDAFSDPTPPKAPEPKALARRKIFGYDVCLIHGQDFEEFDLDQGIAEARKACEAA